MASQDNLIECTCKKFNNVGIYKLTLNLYDFCFRCFIYNQNWINDTIFFSFYIFRGNFGPFWAYFPSMAHCCYPFLHGPSVEFLVMPIIIFCLLKSIAYIYIYYMVDGWIYQKKLEIKKGFGQFFFKKSNQL